MTVYYINLLLILGLAYPLCIRRPSKVKKLAYLLACFGYMYAISTLRRGIGFDYYSYSNHLFRQIAPMTTVGEVLGHQFEPGFALLTWGISRFVTGPVQMYAVYNLLILIPVVWFIYRYCEDAWFSTWLFVTITFFYTTMSFVRQSIACSILLFGYQFLVKKKPVVLNLAELRKWSSGGLSQLFRPKPLQEMTFLPYLLVVLLAAAFHKTALIMIPVYFICNIRLTPKIGIFYSSVTLFFFLTSSLLVNWFVQHFFTYYQNTYYITQGFPPVFLLIPFALFGTCLALWPVWQKRDQSATMLLNMMLYSAIAWLFLTRHFIIERFSMYVYIFALVAVPSAIRSLQASPEEKAQLAQLRAEEHDSKKSGKGKSSAEQNKLRQLAQKVSDHQKYYWSAVVGILLLTMVYHEFGSYVNGFHNVFPYQSIYDPIAKGEIGREATMEAIRRLVNAL